MFAHGFDMQGVASRRQGIPLMVTAIPVQLVHARFTGRPGDAIRQAVLITTTLAPPAPHILEPVRLFAPDGDRRHRLLPGVFNPDRNIRTVLAAFVAGQFQRQSDVSNRWQARQRECQHCGFEHPGLRLVVEDHEIKRAHQGRARHTQAKQAGATFAPGQHQPEPGQGKKQHH